MLDAPFFIRCADYGAPPAKTASTGSAANNRGFRSALTLGLEQRPRHPPRLRRRDQQL